VLERFTEADAATQDPAAAEGVAHRWLRRLLPNAQRVLGSLGTLALLLPMMTVTQCNASKAETLTGLQIHTRSSAGLSALVAEGVVLALVLAWPLVLRGPRLRDLSHATLLSTLCAVVAASAGLLPFLSFMFDTTVPQVGYFAHLGPWVLLYGVVGLAGLSRLSSLLVHQPPAWALLPTAAVFLAQAVLVSLAAVGEDPETVVIPVVVLTPVSVPLGVSILASAARVRADPGEGRGLLGLSMGLALLWVLGCGALAVAAVLGV